MKKQRKSNRPGKAKRQAMGRAQQVPAQPTRRQATQLIRNGVIAAVLLAGGGGLAVSAVRSTAHEQDLSRLGSGMPSVVQIHDPGCSLCLALQKETRAALDGFEAGQIDYIVANIKTEAGSQFAARHGQPHVTLMLMDPDGAPVRVLNGPQERENLERIFAAHIAAFE